MGKQVVEVVRERRGSTLILAAGCRSLHPIYTMTIGTPKIIWNVTH